MFVLPAMILKGAHMGYTRFMIYTGWYKPIFFTESNGLRIYHPDEMNKQPISQIKAAKEKEMKEKKEEGLDISLCPVAPALRAMGLHKKKPPGHPKTGASKELLQELTKAKTLNAQ